MGNVQIPQQVRHPVFDPASPAQALVRIDGLDIHQRNQTADKYAPNHKAFRFQIIHHLASAHSRMLRVLMVNLTHNLKVSVRFALKRFVVVRAVGSLSA